MFMVFDPPYGWEYGFPKKYEVGETNLKQLLLDSGYPPHLIEYALSFGHHWIFEE